MENSEKLIDKRQCVRFRVNDGAYTVLGYKPSMMLEIINISTSGIAVRYSDNGQQLSEFFELDIFLEDSNFYIEKIQAKTIFDVEMNDTNPSDSNKIRQRGFQFGELKSIQKFQVDYFLQNFTM